MRVVDTEAAVKRLMRFLAVEGVTGREARIGKELAAALKEAGVPSRSIRLDDANTRIPPATETGKLFRRRLKEMAAGLVARAVGAQP